MPDETHSDSLFEEFGSRRAFFRRAGSIALVGLGALAIPTARASATVRVGKVRAVPLNKATCCKSSCKTCSSGHAYTCTGCGQSCCICASEGGVECFTVECPIC